MAATPLTKARPNSIRRILDDYRPVAASAYPKKGGLAACKAGYYLPASGDPDEVVVGIFYESVDNTSGSAGDKNVHVRFFRERVLFLCDNDTDALVVVANRETPCSLLDDHTATLFTTAKGAGALVYDVTDEGVWIELAFPASPDDAALPRIQKGTTTLVSGTKTVTGVTLTATSSILLTMRDPGAGAITGMAGLDAPVASRNTTTGQFVVNAIDDSKATIATAVCTVDYLIVG